MRCRCRMSDLDVTGGRVRSVTLIGRPPTAPARGARGRRLPSLPAATPRAMSLSCCARAHGPQDAAMGVRIEHLQADVDRALYGPAAGNPALGAARTSSPATCRAAARRSASACAPAATWSPPPASAAAWSPTAPASRTARAQTPTPAFWPTSFGRPAGRRRPLPASSCSAAAEAAFAAGSGAYVAPAQPPGGRLPCGDALLGRRPRGAHHPRGVAWGCTWRCLPGLHRGHAAGRPAPHGPPAPRLLTWPTPCSRRGDPLQLAGARHAAWTARKRGRGRPLARR